MTRAAGEPLAGDEEVEARVRRHLELHTAVAIAALLRVLDAALGRGLFSSDDVERRFPFLESVADRVDDLAGRGRGDVITRLHRLADELLATAPAPTPLARLVAVAGDADAVLADDVVATATLVERDGRFADVLASLQPTTGARRPCLGLLGVLFGVEPERIAVLVERLEAAGVVVRELTDEPRAEQTIRVPGPVLSVLEGRQPIGCELLAADRAPSIADLVLPVGVRARVERTADLLATGDLDAVVVRGGQGTGRRSVLRAMAGRAGQGVVVADPREPAAGAAPAVALLAGALLTWSIDPALGELSVVPGAAGTGAVAVVTGRRGAVRVDDAVRTVGIDLPVPGPEDRREFWARSGLDTGDEVLTDLAGTFVLSGGTIAALAPQAQAVARVEGRHEVAVADVRIAARDQARQQLESFAALLPELPVELAPVLSGTPAEAFDALVLRVRHREQLPMAVGGAAGEQLTRGVRAMLSGPSGTGKTLAARALGTRLGLDVYRADLAALVDKYIGETERRLDELFRRAEELDVVLLIDEGDALLTRRTDVSSSNDRYANLETDFLLQRLEAFEGIVLITTNAPRLVDSAFLRRFDVNIAFGPPTATDRLHIWRRHLPERHAVSRPAIEHIAAVARLTGGQIRNASVHAALLAVDAGRMVDDATLRTAVAREFTLAGLSSPLDDGTPSMSPFERAAAAP